MHDIAWVYDLEVGGYSNDIGYWKTLVKDRNATRVLELACGTGRIILPVAEAVSGHGECARVVGLDNSIPMLDQARKNLSELQQSITAKVDLVEGNMADFCLDETFDVIIIGLNSLMYLYSQEDQLSCLTSVRNHLSPGGCFAFDILTPALDYLHEAQRVPIVRLEMDRSAPELGIRQFLRFATEYYDAATQLSRSKYFYEVHYENGQSERFNDQLDWQMIFPREMELLARSAGLRTVAAYGDYARTPFDRTSKQMLWIMEAADSPH